MALTEKCSFENAARMKFFVALSLMVVISSSPAKSSAQLVGDLPERSLPTLQLNNSTKFVDIDTIQSLSGLVDQLTYFWKKDQIPELSAPEYRQMFMEFAKDIDPIISDNHRPFAGFALMSAMVSSSTSEQLAEERAEGYPFIRQTLNHYREFALLNQRIDDYADFLRTVTERGIPLAEEIRSKTLDYMFTLEPIREHYRSVALSSFTRTLDDKAFAGRDGNNFTADFGTVSETLGLSLNGLSDSLLDGLAMRELEKELGPRLVTPIFHAMPLTYFLAFKNFAIADPDFDHDYFVDQYMERLRRIEKDQTIRERHGQREVNVHQFMVITGTAAQELLGFGPDGRLTGERPAGLPPLSVSQP